MDRIKTSVIIPVYNTAEYLEECIDSVLAQTQKEIEIFLVDDGSTDGSLEIIDRYAEQYPFIHKLTQEHAYQGTARNRGLELAQGEYVYFMDSDDAILPELFETCYEVCERMKLDYATFDAYGFRYDENDVELRVPDDIFDRTTLDIENRVYSGPEFWNTFYNRHGILYLCWLHYIRRDFLLKNGLFYEERTYFEDNDWTLRLYLAAERLYFIPRQLHRHRWRRGSNMLDGFTLGLLHGCFRMHDVLLELYRGETDEGRLKMISDVIRLNICRFDRLREVDPAKGYMDLLRGFCDHLAEAMPRETEDALYYVHFAAAERILRAAGAFEDREVFDRLTAIAGQTFIKRYPILQQNKTVAVYGTGMVSRVIAELLDKYLPERACRLIFAHTTQQTGTTFCGYPVYNVADAPAQQPDVIVVGSVAYRDSILKQIRAYFPEEQLVYYVPREVKFLQENRQDFQKEANRLPSVKETGGTWQKHDKYYVWGLSYTGMRLFLAFPELTDRVEAFICSELGLKEFKGVPVLDPSEADWTAIAESELYYVVGSKKSQSSRDVEEKLLAFGQPKERLHPAAQLLQEYLSLWELVEYRPRSVRVEASTLCQLDCEACYMRLDRSGTMGRGNLSIEAFQKLLDENPGIRTVELSKSGEAFMNPQLHEILQLAYERGVMTTLINGVNFNDISDQVLEDLVRCRVETVWVSIDGATQDTYARYRKNGSLDKVLHNIRRLNELKARYGSDRPQLVWKYVIMQHNQQEIEQAAEMAEELGMERSYTLDWRGGVTVQDREMLCRVTGLRCFSVDEYLEEQQHRFNSDFYCGQMIIDPQINWDGRLLGCCTVYRSDWGVNVFQTPLKEIYNNSHYRAAVLSLLRGEDICPFEGPCRTCDIYRTNVKQLHYKLEI